MNWLPVIIVAAVIAFSLFFAVLARYKRCPSDKVMVIYGKVGRGQSARCIHGGAAFIWPVLQNYQFLDLTPITLEIQLEQALSQQKIRVDVPSNFTVGISTEPGKMQNAAERLLGQSLKDIQELARDIIFGQLRLVIASMSIEEINDDRDRFMENVTANVESELEKIGLRLINVNIKDITDESGYIDALGKKAAAEAINMARMEVAQKERDGAVGEAEATRDKRIKVADADAVAVEGENEAKIKIANSEANRREKQAEADRKAVAAEKVQSARAQEEAYHAEREAETARADREKATQKADVIVQAEIAKEKAQIDADAVAERTRRQAKGEADATFAKMEARARGVQEILDKQAVGFSNLVKAAAEDPEKAAMLLVVDKLPELVKTQVEAIKNIKIDKVTVWDTGANKGNGKTSTASFLSGLMSSIPSLKDIFNQAGMELPSYFGKEIQETEHPESAGKHFSKKAVPITPSEAKKGMKQKGEMKKKEKNKGEAED